MCEIKVYKVQSGLEDQCIAEDSEVRIFMSAVREVENEAGKDSLAETIILLMIEIFFSFSVAYFVSLWAIPAAYNERGYEAYGGEYILIFLAFVTAYKNISLFFEYFRRKKAWKKEK